MITGSKRTTDDNIELSLEQEYILDYIINESGSLMIQAGAGTGKTFILLRILRYLSGDVFMGAFNKSIQVEIDEKVGRMRLTSCKTTVKTLHAAGLAAFSGRKSGAARPKINADKMWHMVDELAVSPATEKEDKLLYSKYKTFLVKLVGFAKLAGFGVLPGLDIEDHGDWEDIIEHYSVDDELPEDSEFVYQGVGADSLTPLIDLAIDLYELSLSSCLDPLPNLNIPTPEVDFNDMLLAPLYYKSQFPQYDAVLLDEVQDCSAVRQEIGVRMLKPTGRMVAVGDRFQNIYGFTGCRPNEMEILRDRLGMKELPLMTTFRCPQVAVQIAQGYVPEYKAAENAPQGTYRQIWLEPEPCLYCGGDVRTDGSECPQCHGKKQPGFWDEAAGLNYQDVILCRNNKPLVELAYQLLRRGIPCQIEGRDFASNLVKLALKWKIKDLNKLETKLEDYKLKEMAKWQAKGNNERAASIEDKVDTLLCLLGAVKESGKHHVTDLVDKINQMFGEVQAGQKPRVLTLSTIHKAKGKEWQRVYLLGRFRYMPSKWAKKDWEVQCETINLPYVMVTRVKAELVEVHVPETSSKRKQ